MPHRWASKLLMIKKFLLGTHFFFNSYYLVPFRIGYPSRDSVEASRIARALQEYQRQDMLSTDMAAFHILIPIQEFILEKP